MTRVQFLRLAAWTGALALIALPILLVTEGGFGAERWPFRQMVSHGPFVQVSEQQIKAIAQPLLADGYFAADLGAVQAALEQLPWIDHVEVRKAWPDQLDIRVFERVAAARWNDDHLLSTDGQIFSVPGAPPAGLPALSGPDARAAEVLAGFRETAAALADAGLTLISARMTERGSWRFGLEHGGELDLGNDPDLTRQRLARFVAVFGELPGADAERLQRVDLRYANGFAIAWAPRVDAVPPAPMPAPPAPTTNSTDPSEAPRI